MERQVRELWAANSADYSAWCKPYYNVFGKSYMDSSVGDEAYFLDVEMQASDSKEWCRRAYYMWKAVGLCEEERVARVVQGLALELELE